MKGKILLIISFFLVILFFSQAFSQEPQIPLPKLEIGVGTVENPDDLVVTIEILLLLTVLTLAPSILIMFTSFTRLLIVFGLVRNAIGTRTAPSNQVLAALSIFLTIFIMEPQFSATWEQALQPYMNREITYQIMFERTGNIFKDFMVRQLKMHRNEDNVDMLLESTGKKAVEKIEDADFTIIIPAFIVGELEIAFKMGILLYIPFIILDLVTSSVLLAMGMIMIPPVLISMPFKILLFVVVNGWDLLIGGLIRSF